MSSVGEIGLVAIRNMSQKPPVEWCRYSACKLDSQVLPVAKAAAALREQDVQEWLSDIANRESAKELNRKPIKRRPVRGRGRPPAE